MERRDPSPRSLLNASPDHTVRGGSCSWAGTLFPEMPENEHRMATQEEPPGRVGAWSHALPDLELPLCEQTSPSIAFDRGDQSASGRAILEEPSWFGDAQYIGKHTAVPQSPRGCGTW